MPSHVRRGTGLAVLIVVVGAAACSGGGSEGASTAPASSVVDQAPAGEAPLPEEDEPVQTRPFEVTVHEEVYVDETRPTPAGSETPEQPSRTLVTRIVLPERDEPSPLIILSHGLGGNPDKFTELMDAWATAGYAVAAPAFPLTNNTIAGSGNNTTDVVNQPDDVLFVLNSVLAAAGQEDSPLYGTIDPDRVGAAGHSLGGVTTYRAAADGCCRDERFQAVIVMAGAAPNGFVRVDGLPTLLLHSTDDTAIPYELGVVAYETMATPKYFASLPDGGHSEPFEDLPSPHDEYTAEVTTAFWDRFLGDVAVEDWPGLAAVDELSELVYDEG